MHQGTATIEVVDSSFLLVALGVVNQSTGDATRLDPSGIWPCEPAQTKSRCQQAANQGQNAVASNLDHLRPF